MSLSAQKSPDIYRKIGFIMLRIIWQCHKYFILLAMPMDTTHKLCTSSSCAQQYYVGKDHQQAAGMELSDRYSSARDMCSIEL